MCEWCSEPLPKRSRKDARYCSSRCRTAACRYRAQVGTGKAPVELPKGLTRLPRWIRRSAHKVPLATTGGPAASNEPRTWSTYAEASQSSVGVGLGFVLSGDGVICVDLDHCIVDGRPTEEAAAFLAEVPPTYIELSPGGDGLHVWGTGLVLSSRKIKCPDLQGEVIGARKYATMTGDRFADSPLTLADISGPAGRLIY